MLYSIYYMVIHVKQTIISKLMIFGPLKKKKIMIVIVEQLMNHQGQMTLLFLLHLNIYSHALL